MGGGEERGRHVELRGTLQEGQGVGRDGTDDYCHVAAVANVIQMDLAVAPEGNVGELRGEKGNSEGKWNGKREMEWEKGNGGLVAPDRAPE